MGKEYILHQIKKPSAMSQAVAPIARVWKNIQTSVANILGFKDGGSLSGAVTGVGLTTLIAASMITPLAPLAAIGGSVTTAGIVGLVENSVTNALAGGDETKIKKVSSSI